MKSQTTTRRPLEATNMSRPRTIQIHLPNGDPRGIRVGETNPSIVQVIEVPRSLLADFLAMSQSSHTGLYFLLGEDESATPSVYIGRAYDVGASLSTHHSKTDAWNRAMVVFSLTDNLTPVHTQLLEWMSIQEAGKAGRYTVENETPRWKPLAPPPLEADCHDIFDTARMLLATMGQPIFEPVAASDRRSTN
jgi:hypothetical protein